MKDTSHIHRAIYVGKAYAKRLEQLLVVALHSHAMCGGSNVRGGGNVAQNSREVPNYLLHVFRQQLGRESERHVTLGTTFPEDTFKNQRVRELLEEWIGGPLHLVGRLSDHPAAVTREGLPADHHNLLVLWYRRLYRHFRIGTGEELLVGDVLTYTPRRPMEESNTFRYPRRR